MIGSVLVVVAVFAPLLFALAVLVARPRGLGAGRLVAIGCGVAALASLALVAMSGMHADGRVGEAVGWPLHVDRASALLLTAVMTTGVVVASFSRRSIDLDPRGLRFFVLLGALVTGSGLVVVHGSWLALLVGWLGSTWALVALVGHRSELPATRSAQRTTGRALVVGDGALVLAIALVVGIGGGNLSRDVASVAAGLGDFGVIGLPASDIVAVLLVVAGASRSALIPWHRWLSATLAAPTPVSALVHAGFVSGAGLLLVRFHTLVLNSPIAIHAAFFIAVATVILAAGAAATRVDVKGKLVWSTVGQMGFMVVQASVGALSSAVLHIIGHGMYKASMFLGAGDAISAGLRSTRRAAPLRAMSKAARVAWSISLSTAALVGGMWVLPPQLSDGGVVLVAVFAWSTTVHAVWGWLSRGAMSPSRSVLLGTAGAGLAVFSYLGGLRLMERFLEPSFGEVTLGPGVGATTLLITIGFVAVVVGGVMAAPLTAFTSLRRVAGTVFTRTAHPGASPLARARVAHRTKSLTGSGRVGVTHAGDPKRLDVSRSQIRADISRASAIIAPAWPLTSFLAVNPLGGLEQLGFEDATTSARHHLRARTHLSLSDYRTDHANGVTCDDDLDWAITSSFLHVCASADIRIDGIDVSVAEVLRLDMLHGPEEDFSPEPLTALERAEGTAGALGTMVDAAVSHSIAQFVAHRPLAGVTGTSFHEQWVADAIKVAGLRRHLGPEAFQWLRDLRTDPADVIMTAFAVAGVDSAQQVSEMRGHLARLKGWAGLAKWRTDWAHNDEQRAKFAPIDIVAARCALEAACLLAGSVATTVAMDAQANGNLTERRVDAVLSEIGANVTSKSRESVVTVLSRVDAQARNSCWLTAQERAVEQRLLSKLHGADSDTTRRAPVAQLAFCIDVRSEGLRRHLEATGHYDTIGFAGFFGIAMSVRRIAWVSAEARCPVLVAPSVRAVEKPSDAAESLAGIDRLLASERLMGGATGIHSLTKTGAGAPFAMAEAAGWVAGPVAAARTLLPSRPKRAPRLATTMLLDGPSEGGLDLEQRVFTAEAVLRTMGLTESFAPLVVLCGHASPTVNNPHATALDCGACAGASGEDNARTVAVLINDPEVRDGLRERGIDIPDGTYVVAGLHDTISDQVEILDAHLVPSTHQESIQKLKVDLVRAGARQSADRAVQLPGRAASVTRRGADWAQIRPEWGLARNTSFIIGPRAMSAGTDLEGRSFLHSYDARLDPDGKVLETIMTAPLVVAHWISSQYYFSTVDPVAFGAGDKLLHNILGDVGVIQGESGDLRIGLPLQSTHCGDDRHHQPVRLLAVIEAPLERIEHIIEENAILKTLIGGAWIRIAGRSHSHEPWSIRSANGTWSAEPRTRTATNILENS